MNEYKLVHDYSDCVSFGSNGSGAFYYDYEVCHPYFEQIIHDTKVFDSSYDNKNLFILVRDSEYPFLGGYYEYTYDADVADSYGEFHKIGDISVDSKMTPFLYYLNEEYYGVITTNIPVLAVDGRLLDKDVVKIVHDFFVEGNSDNVLNGFEADFGDSGCFDSKYNLKGFECNDSVLAIWTGATNPTLVSNENLEVSEYVAIYADYGKFTAHLDTVSLNEFKYVLLFLLQQ